MSPATATADLPSALQPLDLADPESVGDTHPCISTDRRVAAAMPWVKGCALTAFFVYVLTGPGYALLPPAQSFMKDLAGIKPGGFLHTRQGKFRVY